MTIHADTYGWAIEWATPDDLSGATSAAFHVRASGRRSSMTLPADIVQDGETWRITHIVAENTFVSGVYQVRPVVEFGASARLSAEYKALTIS